MIDRRIIRRHARSHVRRHYILLALLCAVSVFLGAEFNSVPSNAQTLYDLFSGQAVKLDVEGMSGRAAFAKVVNDLINDNLEAGYAESAARMQALRDDTDPGSVLGRQRGVLAAVMNSISTGHLFATMALALHNLVHSRRVATVLMILVSALIYAAVWIFLKNVYGVIMRRAFLETRVYRTLPLSHLFHLKVSRRWVRASLTMLWATVCETLWDLTVVGGFIKHYSYLMVPFITAENPDIRPRQALLLSRRMMNGHKWECFLLDLSLVPWRALGFLTFGAADIMWALPHQIAAHAEYYAAVRREAVDRGIPGAEWLNDRWLYEKADPQTLRDGYADIVRHADIIDEDIVELSPARRFFAQTFGLWTGSLAEKAVFSRQQGLRQRTRIARLECGGEAYPERLNPLWNHARADLTRKVSYLTPCTVWSLIVVFFVFCFIGWIWEVSLHMMTEGGFVNRGALHGPWLPIYGSGVAMIAVLLYRLRPRPALEALAVVLLCGTVEYLTSYFMELSRGMRWWDYTGYFLNLNGRICGEGLAVFAVGGMAAVYLLVPVIDAMVTRLKPRILIPVCIALMLLFTGDVVYSHFVPNAGTGITDIGDAHAERQP